MLAVALASAAPAGASDRGAAELGQGSIARLITFSSTSHFRLRSSSIADIELERNLFDQADPYEEMGMKKRPVIVLGCILVATLGVAAFVTLSIRTQAASPVSDPRQEPPVVRLV